MRVYEDQLIVVTGGAGFIGSCLVKHLNDLGFSNILIVDHFGSSDKWSNLVGRRFIDIIDKQQLFAWLAEGRDTAIEAFIHLGACSSTTETDASYLLENNYRYTLQLAEYALRYNKRFIYASSASTYGDGFEGFSDAHERLDKLHPLNMYGYSKHLFDLWAKSQGVLNQVVGLKYFNVFGPNEGHKGRMASAITRMVPQVQQEGVIKLFKSSEPAQFGNGEQKRDFIYVKDAVRMTAAFLFNDATGIFNVGSGQAMTWNALARAVFKALGVPERIQYIDMPADLKGKYQNFTQATMDKTRSCLKDKAIITPLDDAVLEYVCDYILPGKKW